MAKMWRRRLREDDEDEDEDDEEEEEAEGRYRRPQIEARHYDPGVIEGLMHFDEDDGVDSSHVDDLLDRVRNGKYRPKRKDHWSVHVAYNLIKSREK